MAFHKLLMKTWLLVSGFGCRSEPRQLDAYVCVEEIRRAVVLEYDNSHYIYLYKERIAVSHTIVVRKEVTVQSSIYKIEKSYL